MPKLTKLTSLIIAAGFLTAGVANAQEVEMDPVVEPVSETDYFASADANADSLLDRNEYMAYVNARADAGEEDYIAIRKGGNLETLFKIKDANEDGYLDRSELETS